MSANPLVQVVVLSAEELRELVTAAVKDGVRRALEDSAAAPLPSEWMGVEEAAAMVGVTRDYLRKLNVPHHGSYRRRRYKRSEVERWLQAHSSGRAL